MKVKYGTIIVKDMDESIKFYTEVLGFKIDSRFNPRPGTAITLLKGDGDALVELIKNEQDKPGLYSLGMDVEDVKSVVKKLKAKGAVCTMEPTPITGGFLAFIEDPNGVRIGLVQHK